MLKKVLVNAVTAALVATPALAEAGTCEADMTHYYQTLIPLVEIAPSAPYPCESAELQDLTNQFLRFHNQFQDFAGATSLGSQRLELTKDLCGSNHPATIKAELELATANFSARDFENAITHFEPSIKAWSENQQLNNAHLTTSLSFSATAYYHEGQLDKATHYARQTLSLHNAIATTSPISLGLAQQFLATLLFFQDKGNEAEPLFKASLKNITTTQELPPAIERHSHTGLFCIYAGQNRHAEAETEAANLRAIDEKTAFVRDIAEAEANFN